MKCPVCNEPVYEFETTICTLCLEKLQAQVEAAYPARQEDDKVKEKIESLEAQLAAAKNLLKELQCPKCFHCHLDYVDEEPCVSCGCEYGYTESEAGDSEMTEHHPIQPIVIDDNGVKRFKRNKIVRWLLDEGPFDLNDIAERSFSGEFSDEDQEQFAQLIGYSVSGFSELSYVSDDTWSRVMRATG